MLNPPLSSLSEDLLFYVVEHVSHLPLPIKNLSNLSVADRAFTDLCQAYIFRTFQLGGVSGNLHVVSLKLERLRKILNEKPSIANRVRVVDLVIARKNIVRLFDEPSLISLLQCFATSPKPPHKLHLGGVIDGRLSFQDPIIVVERLIQSFFAQTLTVLHLTKCKNVPLPIFLICSRLREVLLDRVVGKASTYDEFPDNLCSGRELPALEIFDYHSSQSVVKQMINPPPRFPAGVVRWSMLRILTLSPHEKEEMAGLQPILDVVSNTLEELHLTHPRFGNDEQIPLAALVNLRDLSRLRVFALYAIIKCDQLHSVVLHDINTVLGTISTPNNVTNLSFDFMVRGKYPFRGCLDEDWTGIRDEVIRVSAEKPFEFDLKINLEWGILQFQDFEQDNLYKGILEKMASLSEHSNIYTPFWNPAYRAQGLDPFPQG